MSMLLVCAPAYSYTHTTPNNNSFLHSLSSLFFLHPKGQLARKFMIIGAPYKFKKWTNPLFRPKLAIHVIKSQIHLVRQSLSRNWMSWSVNILRKGYKIYFKEEYDTIFADWIFFIIISLLSPWYQLLIDFRKQNFLYCLFNKPVSQDCQAM